MNLISDITLSQFSEEIYTFYHGMPVFITGSSGMLGKHLRELLANFGASVFGINSGLDLTQPDKAKEAFNHAHNWLDGPPFIVFHLAADVGGLYYNEKSLSSVLENNIRMTSYVVEEVTKRQIPLIVCAGSVCGYPHEVKMPAKEQEFYNGYLEDTNFYYGFAKRYALTLLKAVCEEGRIDNFAYPILANMFGRHDKFHSKKAHVIAALIRAAFVSKETGAPFHVLGDGTPTRDFLYAEDAAAALAIAGMRCAYPGDGVVCNIASGVPRSITETAREIMQIVGIGDMPITYTKATTQGQMQRSFDISLAERTLKWRPMNKFHDGLRKTIEWYEEAYYNSVSNNGVDLR